MGNFPYFSIVTLTIFHICFPSSTFPKRFPIGSDRAFPVAPRQKPPSAVPRSWRCRARRWAGTCLGPAGIQVPELRKPEIPNPKSRNWNWNYEISTVNGFYKPIYTQNWNWNYETPQMGL